MKFSKINSIKKVHLDKPVAVFDIAVRDNNNFALSSGLIVHNCQPYQYLKNTIYEERIRLFEHQLLTEELIGLERNNNTGRIDHSPSGINSKDSSDALCGSIWNASQHAEEYDFEYGETLDAIIEAHDDEDPYSDKQQLIVSFEEELKKATKEAREDVFSNMGLGKPTTNYDMLIYDGIII